jgi:hypothetical protein
VSEEDSETPSEERQPARANQDPVTGRWLPGNTVAVKTGLRSERAALALLPGQEEIRATLADKRAAVIADLGGEDDLSEIARGEVERYLRLHVLSETLWNDLIVNGILSGKGKRCLNRKTLPTQRATGLRLIVGRRGGKSRFAAFVAVFLACFCDYGMVLSPGERGLVVIVCPDRRQSRTCLGYINALIDAVPALAAMVERRTQDSIHLTNRISIEVHSKSFRTVRGYTVVAYILDECAFLPTDDSAIPDTELVNALDPAMLTVPGALSMLISSPHAKRGQLWKDYREHFGIEDSTVLVWQADTRTMNPSASQAIISKAYAEDEVVARSEYGAQFRSDLEAFVSVEVLDTVTIADRRELPPRSGVSYAAFVDPSGGAADSMTLAIAHRVGSKVVLDCVREQKAPFDPDEITRQFAAELRRYGLGAATGDYYGGDWPAARFRAFGIRYEPADADKSAIYRANIPLLMAGEVELLDLPVLRNQLLSLERRTTRTGKEVIDHPHGARDDVANAVCGVCWLLREQVKQATIAVIGPNDRYYYDPTQDPESDLWWGAPYYRDGPPRVNLVPAPRREELGLSTSDAMRENIEQEKRDIEFLRSLDLEVYRSSD